MALKIKVFEIGCTLIDVDPQYQEPAPPQAVAYLDLPPGERNGRD